MSYFWLHFCYKILKSFYTRALEILNCTFKLTIEFSILTFAKMKMLVKSCKGELKMTTQNLELLNCEAFAKFLGVKIDTIYSWLFKKQLPQCIYRKLGRKPVFIKSEVDKWILEGCKMEGSNNGK